MAVLVPEDIGGPAVASVREYWVASLVYLTLVSTGIVLFSIYVLRGVLKREASGTQSATVLARLVAPGVETEKVKNDSTQREARDVGDRPVLWRELRQTAVGSGKRTIFALGLGVAILLFLYAIAGLDHSGLTTTLLFIAALGLTAQVALSTPASITAERDAGSWSVLLTTPVRPWQVVLGKTLGAIRRLWLIPAVLGFHLVLVMAAGWFHPVGVLHAAMLIGALVFMLASTGVCLGLVCKRGVVASVLNMGLPLALFMGLPILATMYETFASSGYYYDDDGSVLMDIVLVSNPFAMLTEASTTATGEWDRFSYFLRYEWLEGDETMTVWAFTGFALLCSGGMAAVGGAAIAVATLGFNRWSGRPS
jgi:hypothetical protein